MINIFVWFAIYVYRRFHKQANCPSRRLGAEYEGGGVYLLVIKIVYYSFSHTQVAYLCTVVGLPVLRRKRVVAKTIEDYRTEIVL